MKNRKFLLYKYRWIVSFSMSTMFLVETLAQQGKSYYPITPVPFTAVEITDSFWKERMETNRKVTIPIAFQRSEETGRIKNFKVAGGLEEGTFNTGRGYDDSDVYKVMEGAAYSLAEKPDPRLEKYLDTLIYYVGKAQEDDGYLYTLKTILGVSDKHRDSKLPRWLGIEEGSHELYNAGHMYEAAVAHYQATGKRTFLNIAIKNADLIDREFGWGKKEIVPGHQEIEIGLVKLYGATGDKRYLDLAKFFLDKRGENEHRTAYNQSHKKVTEQDEAVGHSVRAVYMYSAMADIAALTNDHAYLEAMDKLWHDIVDTKLYIIGGIGAAGGHEGFGDHYELPNLRAYNETCAAIGNVFWNYRLFLTHGDAKYIDVLERSLYNNVLSGVSLSGDTFFYPNRLESRGHTVRSEWFSTSCCPSNITRFLPDVPGYIYAKDENIIYINLFISSTSKFNIGENAVALSQTSQLPWTGRVKFNIDPESPVDFALRVRIPGWAGERPVPSDLYYFKDSPSHPTIVKVNGKEIPYQMEKGYAVVIRKWAPKDVVEVEFPYGVRVIRSNSKIKENQGKVALQAGPVVYCVEGFDLPEGQANHIMIDDEQDFKLDFEKDLLKGVMTIQGKAQLLKETASGNIVKEDKDFRAIPYYAWANRGGSEMEVWIPTTEQSAFPEAYPTASAKAKLATSKDKRVGNLYLVNDTYKPTDVAAIEVPYFDFWPLKNTTEWISMTFDRPTTLAKSTVYWAKTKDGGVDYPKSWKLYYKQGEAWMAVSTKKYPINEDGSPSTVSFKGITTDALKLELKMDKKPAGLYEWEAK